MRVIIRADGNKIVAMGHIMRCLSIADALKEKGCEVLFVTASDDSKTLITNRGFENWVLGSYFDFMEMEVPFLSAICMDFQPDVILVDSYYVTTRYFEYLGEIAPTIYVDDYGTHAFPVNKLINYNIYGDELPYEDLYQKENVVCPKLLLGCTYAPLRQEFQNSPAKKQTKNGQNVLISTGGADACHMALTLARQLSDCLKREEFQKTKFHFLVGPYSEDRRAIERIQKDHNEQMIIRENITAMAEFLNEFDMAVSAAGSTTYELCSMGVPTITFCAADNQKQINECFQRKGIMESAGDAEHDIDGTAKKIIDWLSDMCTNTMKCNKQSHKMQQVVDGFGANRIADEIMKL